MDLSDASTQYYAGGIVAAVVIGFLLLQPTGLAKWLQKKNYQYEVTFALYMLTPTEKFIFNSVLFLTLSMFVIACTVYLPDHVVTVSRRTWYYFAGDAASTRQAAESLYGSATRAGDAVLDAAGAWAHTAHQVAKNRTSTMAVAAAEAVAAGAAEAGAAAVESAGVVLEQ